MSTSILPTFKEYHDSLSHIYSGGVCDTYEKNENGTFDSISEDKAELKSRLQDAVKLKITGIIRPKEDAASASLSAPLGYTKALTDYLIDYTDDSAVVKAQKKNKKVNVLSGMTFDPGDDDNKVADAKTLPGKSGRF